MINPSEISEVLKQQLQNVNSKVSFEEVGTVLEVGDGVAHVDGGAVGRDGGGAGGSHRQSAQQAG